MVQRRIADLEVEIRAGGLGEQLVEGWVGYGSRGGPVGLVLEWHGVDGFVGAEPVGRVYPGFGFGVDGERVRFWRKDMEGTLELGTPARAVFRGRRNPLGIEAALRVVLSVLLPREGALLLHSGAVAVADRALVFAGPSGSGKSTITRLLGEGPVRRLGDDLVAVRRHGRRWLAHATPFAGELGPAPDGAATLESIYFLVKSARHLLGAPLSPVAALPRLLRNVMAYVGERGGAAHALEAASALAHAVPCRILEFRMDSGVADVLGLTPGPSNDRLATKEHDE